MKTAIAFNNFCVVISYKYIYPKLRKKVQKYNEILYSGEPNSEFWENNKEYKEYGQVSVTEILFVPLKKMRNFSITASQLDEIRLFIDNMEAGPPMSFEEFLSDV